MRKFYQRTITIRESFKYVKNDYIDDLHALPILDSISRGEYVETIVVDEDNELQGDNLFIKSLVQGFFHESYYVDLKKIASSSTHVWGVDTSLPHRLHNRRPYQMLGNWILDGLRSAHAVGDFVDSLECDPCRAREIESKINSFFEQIRSTIIPVIVITK